jgi:hypothetical protein
MTRDELCWLAGWLEGEGCFYYAMSKGSSPRAIVQVFSTDLDVLQKAARLMGTDRFTKIPPRKMTGNQWKSNGGHRIQLGGDQAADLMRLLLPLMGKRRSEQIKTALEKWDNRPSKPMKKLCACGCGREVFGCRRILYARRETSACAMVAFRARQKQVAA